MASPPILPSLGFRALVYRSMAVLAVMLSGGSSGHAADATWATGSASAWYTAGNWNPAAIPGLQGNAATNTDVATFTSAATSTSFGINMNATTAFLNLGAISVDSTRSIATTIGNSSTTVVAGQVLRLYGSTVNAVPNTILSNAGTGLLTLQNTQGSGTQTMGVVLGNTTNNIRITNTGGITISSIISQINTGSSLTVQGGGTGLLTLSGANTFTGGINLIGASNVRLGAAAGAGTGTITFNTGGAFNASVLASAAVTITNPITVAAGSTGTNTIGSFGNIAVTFGTGAVSVAAGTNLTVSQGGTTALAVNNIISGSGSVSTAGTGTGTIAFGGQSTFTGGFTFGGSGTIAPTASSIGPDGNPTSGPFGAGSAPVILIGSTRSTTNADITIRNTLTLAGNVTVPTVASEKSLVFTGPATLTGTRTFTVGVGTTVAGKSLTFSGAIDDGGNGFGITKAGTGIMVLGGASTYTGATLVNAGTLALNGSGSVNTSSGITVSGSSAKFLQTSSAAATPMVTLTQGTVTGSGTVNTVNVGAGTGGIVSNNDGLPGAALTIGTLTFSGAATINTFSNSTSAAIVTTSLVTNAAGTVTINPSATSWTSGSTYNLVGYGGGSIGGAGFGQFVLGTANLPARYSGVLGDSGSAITVAITGDNPYWVGDTDNKWNTTTINNWKLVTAGSYTTYLANDDVLFNDNAAGVGPISVDIDTANVAPFATTFNNPAKNYVLSSTGGFGISSGSLTKTGAGSLTITTANSYTGTTTLAGGILIANTSAALGDGSATNTLIFSGGTLQAGGAITSPATRTVTLTSTGIIDTNGFAVSIAGIVGGTGGLGKNGTGNLTISGANSFTGTTNINQGFITITTANALGTTAGNTVVAAGGELVVNTTGLTLAEAFNIAGLGVASTGALHTGGNATVGFTGAITLAANSGFQGDGGTTNTISGGIDTAGFSMTFNGSGTVTVGTLGISGAGGSIVKNTGGTLNLTAANSFSGTTTLNAGILSLGHANALQNTSGIILANGTTLRTPLTNGAVTVFAPITTSGNVTINAPTVNTGTQTWNEFILNGAIGGTGNVTFSNIVNNNTILTVTLGAASNYSGTTTLDNTAGTSGQMFLKLGVNDALPTTTVLNILGQTGTGTGRGIDFNLFGFNQTLAGLTNTAFSLRTQRVVNSDANTAATLTINGSTNTTYTGFLGGTAGFSVNSTNIPGSTNGNNFGLTKNGSGTFTISAVNTFYGATKVLGGILSLGNASALSQSPLDTLNSIAGDATNGLQTTVTTLTLGGLTGNKDLASVFTTTAGGYGAVTAIALNPILGANHSYSAVIADGAVGMSLTKAGSGTQILSGIQTYTGATQVNSGTLIVGVAGVGSTAAASAVTVGGASATGTPTLGGTGTINGSLTISGTTVAGTLSPGTGTAGTLTANNGVVLASGSTYAIGLTDNSVLGTVNGGQSTLGTLPNPGSNNFLNITAGGATISSGTKFSIDGTTLTFNPANTYSYQIMQGAGDQSLLGIDSVASPSQFSFNNFANSSSFQFTITGKTTGEVYLNVAPVPEPTTVGLIAAAALILGRRFRRNR